MTPPGRSPAPRRFPVPAVVAAAFAAALLVLAPVTPAVAQGAAPQPAAAPIAPGDSATPASLERLFLVSDAEGMYRRGIDATIAGQLRVNPMLRPYEGLLRDFVAKYASYAQIKPEMMRIYRETFSEREVQELIAFYSSDVGRRLMAKMPLVMTRSSQLSAEMLQPHLPELAREIQQRMQAQPPAGGTTPPR